MALSLQPLPQHTTLSDLLPMQPVTAENDRVNAKNFVSDATLYSKGYAVSYSQAVKFWKDGLKATLVKTVLRRR